MLRSAHLDGEGDDMFRTRATGMIASAALLVLAGCSSTEEAPEPSAPAQNAAVVRIIPESKVLAVLPLEEEDAGAASKEWYADLSAAATALTWQDVRVGDLVMSV